MCGVFSVIAERLLRRVSAAWIIFVQCTVDAVIFAIFAVMNAGAIVPASFHLLAAMAWLDVAATGIAWFLFKLGIAAFSADRVAPFYILVPLFSLLTAMELAHRVARIADIAAAAIAMAARWLAAARPRITRRRPHARR